MALFAYSLCTAAALFCAALLIRGYTRSGYRLLLWGGLCFLGLTANNALVAIDRLLVPDINLFTWRLVVAFLAMVVLLYGIIWDRG
ncbi:MAG TPA: DUF5985 family protein [Candidatus Eisenbacteria bacterium]|nr:DUF5985 family protein [Candidatus Eisenbacteria bacterium]